MLYWLASLQYVSTKGKKLHTKIGNLFLRLLLIVIITGLIGVFVFNRNTFLLIITVLSAYYGFSGYRVLQTKNNKPKLLDISIAIISLIAVFYFLYYFKSIGMYWSPVIIYSTFGALVMIIVYDFLRYLIPKDTYKNIWLYEHIYKMIGAFTALLSAFSGTVFENYQPYSQFLPSVFGTLLQIGFITYYVRKFKKIKSF
ncbi:MAG: hypothetical protein P8I51_01195 [Polaribacter sp.]|nr:hypothetical protein [Polaribacter sp.]MDG1953491.1 hypothetical protein [Polaribacter sp.]